MKKRTLISLGALAIVVTGLALAVYLFMGARYVLTSEGEFRGFHIGWTKDRVLQELVERPEHSRVAAFPKYEKTISLENSDELRSLDGGSAFSVAGGKSGLGWYVCMQEGQVWYTHRSRHNELDFEFLKGEPLDTVIRSVVRLLESRDAEYLTMRPCYREGEPVRGVDVRGNGGVTTAARELLTRNDRWLATIDDSYSWMFFHFEGGRLNLIEYENNFIELP